AIRRCCGNLSISAASRDGEVLELGNVAIKILHTPGHTPEHISLVVTDRTRSNEPCFVLTGHTLMVGDLGRTELSTKAARPGACAVGAHKGSRPCPIIWKSCRARIPLSLRAQP